MESTVHYPTDVTLLYDSGRKCLDMILKASREPDNNLSGWRKVQYWYRQLRKRERQLSRILGQGGKNRATRVEEATEAYLELASRLWDKVQSSLEALSAQSSPRLLAISLALEEYHGLLEKHIVLVGRRLLEGEKIPHSEKLFSIFEQHTEWINKGKKHKGVELGHNVLVATDQFQFVLHHQVIEKQHDVQLAVPTAQTICQTYGLDKLESISFDRGFYSQLNYENLQAYAHQVILPKKGKLSVEQKEREAHKSFVRLRHQHSAIEAHINQLEHHGLNRCPDKGIKAFKRYTAFGVLAYNLHRIVKVLIEQEKQKQKKKKATRKLAA